MTKLDWLVRDGLEVSPLSIAPRTTIDDERIKASYERLELGEELRIHLMEATILRDFVLEVTESRSDPWIASQFLVGGRAEIDFLDGRRCTVTPRNGAMFRTPHRRAAYNLTPEACFLAAGYTLGLGRIERLFDGDVPAALRPLLCPQPEASHHIDIRTGKKMRDLAASLFDRRLNGPLRMLMMEGVVLQLLALQAAAQEGLAARPGQFSRREVDAIHAAREKLLADMRNPPSLGELALAVAIGEKKLNAGFRALFGTSVYETLRNERLEHARIVLEEGEDISLKEIAYRVGYNHASNFITAFTARYGRPPRRFTANAAGAPLLNESLTGLG